uniref:Uncharacterized protein n=1 Tax=Plectus sambesii TaxID=2011161 RepID=A0A914VLB1_9BILA
MGLWSSSFVGLHKAHHRIDEERLGITQWHHRGRRGWNANRYEFYDAQFAPVRRFPERHGKSRIISRNRNRYI